MSRLKMALSAAIVALPAMFAAAPAVQAGPGIEVGLLECSVSGGVGLIITSKKTLSCVYSPASGTQPERYIGSIRKFGLDIGATGRGRIVWTVFAPSTDTSYGALAGNYGGASGEVSAGVGVGAHALVGGFDRQITLQPLSLQGQTGLNLAAGVTRLELRVQ